MYAFRAISLMLISAVALAAANPLIALSERQTCGCQSPSGCPGHCSPLQGSSHSVCIGYCGRPDSVVVCDACGSSNAQCILNDDGSCFTSNSAILIRQTTT
ncbi:hypothetical protein C8J57DRAFT_1508107 [Mycena rebaudengoi]|nr:hypothetical protein C8J57DRAFT_1508107 [Mycena rebaudengoi]